VDAILRFVSAYVSSYGYCKGGTYEITMQLWYRCVLFFMRNVQNSESNLNHIFI
jgi:hypothetical protein